VNAPPVAPWGDAAETRVADRFSRVAETRAGRPAKSLLEHVLDDTFRPQRHASLLTDDVSIREAAEEALREGDHRAGMLWELWDWQQDYLRWALIPAQQKLMLRRFAECSDKLRSCL
jgi:hypothetical protein